MRDVARKDTIKGASVQLAEFKYKLTLFDKALEKLHSDKLSRQEYKTAKKDNTV